MDLPPKTIEVWSDYVCPFCYLEEPVLNQVRENYGPRITIRWRAYELRPEPVPTLDARGDYLKRVWESSVYPMARQRNMTLRLPPIQPRSRLALEAAEFAHEQGRFAELHFAIFRAFFEEGMDIGRMEILLSIGERVGIEPLKLKQTLESGAYRDFVANDRKLAEQLGIQGVPAMLIHSTGQPLESGVLISGAQPYERIASILDRESCAKENIA